MSLSSHHLGRIARAARCVALLVGPAALVAERSVADRIEVLEQWRWEGAADPHDRPHPDGQPIVAQLTDDDGDGLVTPNDTPDVAFMHWGWTLGIEAADWRDAPGGGRHR